MVRKILLFILMIIFLLLSCIRDFSMIDQPIPLRDLTETEKDLVGLSNEFGINLFKEVVKSEEPDTNIFISPLSISIALGMTYNGAAGETEEAMRTTLGFGEMTREQINQSFQSLITLLTTIDQNTVFQIANSIWYKKNFSVNKEFIDINKKYFDAEVRELDFFSSGAKDIINDWVENKTKGKIKEIIDFIDPTSVMFIINAIYFLGDWTYQFDKDLTFNAPFYTEDGSQADCRMMRQENVFNYFETDDFQAVEIPYGNEYFSMIIFLPKEGSSVDEIAESVTVDNWKSWIGMFSEKELNLFLPKFTIKYFIDLSSVLKLLGMEIAFDPLRADFSMINPDCDLYISRVLHKTYVKVDEEGTEAAAVTVVEIRYTSTVTEFRVNRPFIFIIRERHSDSIIFMGRVVDPSSD